jgi:hypothetical protein
MRISKGFLRTLPLSLLAIIGGCFLVSGQITFVHNFGDGTATADGTVYEFGIDLTENKDYNDHKDKIKSVTAVGFEVKVQNGTAMAATAEGYLTLNPLADPSTVGDMQSGEVKIFSAAGNPVDPMSTRVIDFEESQEYMANFDAIQDAVRDGEFYVYITSAEGTEVDYKDLTLVVTMNVEM